MALLFILLLTIPLALLRGLVLSDMIGWFTSFQVGVVQAIGLAFIVTMFTSHLKTSTERKPDQSVIEHGLTVIISQAVVVLLAWGFAYIWHLFL